MDLCVPGDPDPVHVRGQQRPGGFEPAEQTQLPGGAGALDRGQLGAQLLGDVASGKRTEAGGNAVDGGGVCGEFVDTGAGGGDFFERGRVDGHLSAVASDGDDVLDGQRADSY